MQKGKKDNMDETMEKLIRKNIEETLRDCNIDDEAMAKSLAKMNLEDGLGLDKEYMNMGVDCEAIDKLEYIRNDDDSMVK